MLWIMPSVISQHTRFWFAFVVWVLGVLIGYWAFGRDYKRRTKQQAHSFSMSSGEEERRG